MEKKTFKRRVMKRKRALPYRKWSDYETTLLVDYIKENEFEKPNGRIFYQTFVHTFHMNIEWTLVKNKIRNLKTLYEKALAWQRSDAATNVPDGETVQSIINRICPFFDSIKDVFGEKANSGKLKASPSQYNSNLEIEDSHDTVIKSSPPSSPQHLSEQSQTFSPIQGTLTVSDNIINESTKTAVYNPETSIQPGSITADPIESKPSHNNDAFSCLMEVIKMMSSYQKEKTEYQKAHLDLEHKKFDFEKEKTFRDLDLKEREIEKNEKIKVLEIECRERIALKELEYKYKSFSNK